MDAIAVIMLLYWLGDIAFVLYGIPHTLEWSWFSAPKIFNELFSYGKCRGGEIESSLVKWIELPKSWFKHFYIYGFAISSYMVAVTFGCFIFQYDIPGREYLIQLIGNNGGNAMDQYAVMMICTMMLIQHSRRVYECLFVSVYSKGTMNVIHYLYGVILYSTVQICAICDGPQLEVVSSEGRSKLMNELQNIDASKVLVTYWNRVLAVVIFLFASYYHNQSHVILANLRKDRSGQKVLHRQHVIPHGGLFKYLSAPHFVCEILIYGSMGLISWCSWTFWMGPVLFTFINQSLMVSETHRWYKQQFKNYPQRYRFIPYIF